MSDTIEPYSSVRGVIYAVLNIEVHRICKMLHLGYQVHGLRIKVLCGGNDHHSARTTRIVFDSIFLDQD